MIKWMTKKYLVGKLNDLLADYKGNVDKASSTITLWISRLEKILACLKSILAKLDDGKIDSAEIDDTVEDVEAVIKAW